MCGLCYAKSFTGNPVKSIIKNQFENQRSRGTDGFGFCSVYPDHVSLTHRTTEQEIKRALKNTQATEILFHHRIPTSTANVETACHPFRTQGKKTGHYYFTIHNGIISNDDELKTEHYKKGFKYFSKQKNGDFNDSEALATELTLCFEGLKTWKSFNANGSMAFIVLEADKNLKPLKLHYGRNGGSPLMIKDNARTLQISSESNKGEQVETNIIFSRDYKTGKTTRKAVDLNYTYYQPSYSQYDNWGYNDDYGLIRADKTSSDFYDQDFASRSESYADGFEEALDYQYISTTETNREISELSQEIARLDGILKTTTTKKTRTLILNEKAEVLDNMFYYLGYKDGTAQVEHDLAKTPEQLELEDYNRSFLAS